MGNVIVEGPMITLAGDSPITITQAPVAFTVSSSGKFTGDAKKTALKSDMEGQTPIPSIPYIKTGGYVGGVVSWDGKLNGSQESAKMTKDGSAVVVDDTLSGAIDLIVVTPAIKPPPPPGGTPDTGGPYTGTWTLASAGQTKLKTTE